MKKKKLRSLLIVVVYLIFAFSSTLVPQATSVKNNGLFYIKMLQQESI